MMKLNKFFVIVLIAVILFFSCNSICNASASSKSFGNDELSSALDCVDFSVYGLDSLGYDPTYESYGVINAPEILEWIENTGNGYAFYIQTHGNSAYFEDGYGNEIYTYDCCGNWDLIFLDFSDSAYDSDYANAFHTIGYSNRGFLGWFDDIYTGPAEDFGYYFWTQDVGTTYLPNAALASAACVPGAGTTPIRYFGDTSYDGSAR